ncbi:MAG: threonine synthase [Candidatus Moranbacteria bacterium]|nr:threonine synthase [Candidatus Moranbacteria bacterium]
MYDVVQPDIPEYDIRILKQRFGERARANLSLSTTKDPTVTSGVWRYKELILPDVPDEAIVTLGEGNSPIIRAGNHLRNHIGIDDLWLIMEGEGPTGSFKDWGGTVMMTVAKLAGIKLVGCASTGDTSAMTAAYAAAAGIRSVVLLPKGRVTDSQMMQPQAYGSTIILVPGDFDVCNVILKGLVRSGEIFPANSMNPTRIAGHQATVFRIAQFFNWKLPDWIAVPVGNGSDSSSIGLGLRKMRQLRIASSRVLGVQSEMAAPLYQSFRDALLSFGDTTPSIDEICDAWAPLYRPIKTSDTIASAMCIGDATSQEKVIRTIRETDGWMDVGNENELPEIFEAAGKDGLLLCPQTAVMLAGVKHSVASGKIARGSRVVGVSTANPLKFSNEISRSFPNTVREVSGATLEEVCRLLEMEP